MSQSSLICLSLQLCILLSLTCSLYGVPPETCLVSGQCTSYCQSFGYARGLCRTKVQYSSIAPIKRYCLCSGCSGKYCRNYCEKIGRKFTGCTCFNFSQRVSLLQKNDISLGNDCNNDVLYCQCSR